MVFMSKFISCSRDRLLDFIVSDSLLYDHVRFTPV